MNLTELLRTVKREFGDESGVQIDNDDIVRWANDGQIEIVRRTESLAEVYDLNSTVGLAEFDVPNALKILMITYNGHQLQRITRKQMNKWYGDRFTVGYGNGTPSIFIAFGNKIEMHRSPDSVVPIRVYFLPKPAALAVGFNEVLDIPEEMHDDLVQYCLRRAHEQNGDWEAAQFKAGRFNEQSAESMHQFAWNDVGSYPVVQDDEGY